MMYRISKLHLYFRIYLAAEILLFILIQLAEWKMPYSVTGKLMYGVILLNLVTGLVFWLSDRQGYSGYVLLGLVFTAGADCFLVLLDRGWLAGVILFCVVQTIYAAALGIRWQSLLLRAGIWILFLFILYGIGMLDVLTGFAAFSMAQLTVNVICGWIRCGRRANTGNRMSFADRDFLFALGLTLFAGCDISLGIRNGALELPALASAYSAAAWLIWIFYVPSQILIVRSGKV